MVCVWGGGGRALSFLAVISKTPPNTYVFGVYLSA